MKAIQKLNNYIEIPEETFKKNGVFNPFVGVDAHFFLDPTLLRETTLPEFTDSYSKMVKHFSDVLTLLKASKTIYDKAWMEAWKRLVFRETKGISIGYGANTSDGSAIGFRLAKAMTKTAHEIVQLGIEDPALFELIPLFENGLGADRLSDMAISIIIDDIYTYSENMIKTLKVNKKYLVVVKSKKTRKELIVIKSPIATKKYIILLPEELLRDLPLVLDRDDLGETAYFNEELRRRLSAKLLKDAVNFKDLTKPQYKEALLKKDEIEAVIKAYKKTESQPYDFEKDPNGELSWSENGKEFVKANPLEIKLKKPKTIQDVNSIVRQIVEQFRRSIEHNNLYELLYKEPIKDLKPKNERAAQRLFYAIADAYCDANNIVLSREPNAGNGPVDFKVSSDYKTQVLVEIKLSSGKVLNGFEKQLPEYEKNEKAGHSFLVVLQVTGAVTATKKVMERATVAREEGKHVPDVILINALPRESASK